MLFTLPTSGASLAFSPDGELLAAAAGSGFSTATDLADLFGRAGNHEGALLMLDGRLGRRGGGHGGG